jgi:predicted peroxiredoxin
MAIIIAIVLFGLASAAWMLSDYFLMTRNNLSAPIMFVVGLILLAAGVAIIAFFAIHGDNLKAKAQVDKIEHCANRS